MSLIGKDGIIQLARAYPDPIVLPPSALDIANSRLLLTLQHFGLEMKLYLYTLEALRPGLSGETLWTE